jgi:hypothetical protein
MYQITFDPISNRADWFETFELVDDDTGEVITDTDDITVDIEVRHSDCRQLSGSRDDGVVTDLGFGVFQWHFTAAQMRSLPAQTYDIGVVITRDDIKIQEIIGVVPVLDGVVRP